MEVSRFTRWNLNFSVVEMSSKSSFLKKKPKQWYSKKIENLLKNNIWFNLTCERKKKEKNLSTYFNGKVIVCE